MAEGIGPDIAETFGVGRAANAEGIQDEQECTRHL
ncbi:protein of unknown function [Aminobacter niigataensis]|nr:protein of unknown function [Aminobacter niigataensis]